MLPSEYRQITGVLLVDAINDNFYSVLLMRTRIIWHLVLGMLSKFLPLVTLGKLCL